MKDILKNKYVKSLLILFGLAVICLFICLTASLNIFSKLNDSLTDSSVFRYLGYGMTKGLVPYRDMFDHKGLLLYFINYAGNLMFFYKGIWIIEFLFMFGSVVFTYKFARKKLSIAKSFLVVLVVFSPLFQLLEGGNLTEEYALVFEILSLFIFFDYNLNPQKYSSDIKDNKKHKLRINYNWFNFSVFLCGICFSCVFMIRANMVALWGIMCLYVLIDSIKNKKYKELIKFALSFILGMVVVLIPILIYLISNNALNDFIYDYFIFNKIYSSFTEKNAKLEAIKFFLENSYVMLSFIIMFVKITKNKNLFDIAYIVYMIINLLLTCMSGFKFQHYGMTLVPMIIYPFIILFDYVQNKNMVKIGLDMLVLGYILFIMVVPSWKNYVITGLEKYNDYVYFDETKVEKDELINYIVKNTKKDDYISVFGNENLIYLKSKRLSASKYSYQFPVITIDPKIEEEYFEDLEKNKPKIIVISKKISDAGEVGERLKKYLEDNNYQKVKRLKKETYILNDR